MLLIILIAISLSTDTFSLSLLYGTLNLGNQKELILSLLVGLFHFFMPLLGQLVGKNIMQVFPNVNFLIFIIFTLIGIEMIIESFKNNKKVSNLSFIGMLSYAIAVSVDSFTLGIGINVIYNSLLASFIFFIFSFIFTLMGLKLGKIIKLYIGKLSTIFGGFILIVIGILHIM